MGDKFRHKIKKKNDSLREGYNATYNGHIQATYNDYYEEEKNIKKPKHCLVCQAEHYHNNSYCSAECNKITRQK